MNLHGSLYQDHREETDQLRSLEPQRMTRFVKMGSSRCCVTTMSENELAEVAHTSLNQMEGEHEQQWLCEIVRRIVRVHLTKDEKKLIYMLFFQNLTKDEIMIRLRITSDEFNQIKNSALKTIAENIS